MTTGGNETKRIETKLEVDTYLQRLAYSLASGCAEFHFVPWRHVDERRNERFTNRFTVGDLFPDEDPSKALKRELLTLTVENYIETVKDINCPQKSEMRVFCKRYSADVYIKIRVELLKSGSAGVSNTVFVMSFHYAEHSFAESDFPYKKK